MKKLYAVGIALIGFLNSNAQRDEWYALTTGTTVYATCQDENGNVHVGTNDGYCLFDKDFVVQKQDNIFNSELEDGKITALCESSGNVWMVGNYINIYKKSGTSYNQITYNPDNPISTIYRIWVNSSGNALVGGGYNDSLVHIQNGAKWDAIRVKGATDFVEGNGKWYFSTYDSGVVIINPTDMGRTSINRNNSQLFANLIYDLEFDKTTGSIFCATDAGIYEINPDNSIASYNNFNYGSLQTVHKMGDTILASTRGFGLCIVDLKTNTWTQFPGSSLFANYMSDVYAMGVGKFMLSGFSKVAEFVAAADSYTPLACNNKGLPIGAPRSFEFRSVNNKHELFLAYPGDGIRICTDLTSSESQISLTQENSKLGSDNVNDMDVDPAGNVWVATDNNAVLIDLNNQVEKVDQTKFDGLIKDPKVKLIAAGGTKDNVQVAAVTGTNGILSLVCGAHTDPQTITSSELTNIGNITEVEVSETKERYLALGTDKGELVKINIVLKAGDNTFSSPQLFNVGGDNAIVDDITPIANQYYEYGEIVKVQTQEGFTRKTEIVTTSESNPFTVSNKLRAFYDENYSEPDNIETAIRNQRVFKNDRFLYNSMINYIPKDSVPLKILDAGDSTFQETLRITNLNFKPGSVYKVGVFDLNIDSTLIVIRTGNGVIYRYYPRSTEGIFDVANKRSIILYPNPSTGEFLFQSQEKGIVRIFDLTGNELINQGVEQGENAINCTGFSNGLYVVRVETERGISSGRIQVLH
ncbi:MAG: T9SS type A sorting domain-containing protein [Bacteroidetes bacterium]|nr:T9SS type A sorting domain-containing protein [Bacteroidota bacterium]